MAAENATTTTSIDLPSEFGQSTLVIDDDEDSDQHLEVEMKLPG